MNMNQSPTADQLGQLLGTKNDEDGSHTLWIDRAGGVHLDVVGDNESICEDARLRYAPFEAGIGFVGEDAASDSELIEDLLASLVEQWAVVQNSPPGVRLVDLDDPESGPDWTMTEVTTVDDEFLARLSKALH